ncbi:hypothetical protein QVD17_10914 [Tagetes erecta]|uniref:Protein kinase domain-containing protein n=1 Tax=Tagetes erecta TaxID=13708 RepID=A0AAD8P6R9_TARER|nr:hypothetical protein QVD17_10914 [Tagetes erecta]
MNSNELKMNKRSLFDEENVYEVKKTKKRDWKLVENNNMYDYGDGVAWFRGAMIGKGSFGCVFVASLKNPKARYSSYPSVMAVKSAEVSVSGSIQKEKEVMDNIRGCRNVIKCFGEEITNGENGQMVYNLLLEYGSGGTLADVIKSCKGEGLREVDVRRYARSIVVGLNHIHKKGYVHCDLKPENILLVSSYGKGDFVAKIGDFGLAKRANRMKKKKNKLGCYWRGTPMYFSPEAVINGVQEQPADIWAVGCIVFQMLTGKPIWFSDQELVMDEDVLSRICDENVSPFVSSTLSAEAISFLKGCLCRKVMCRLTANMLLNHPFLKGLVDDNAKEIEEPHEVFDINAITSSSSFSDDDNDGDSWPFSCSDDSSSYNSVSFRSDET